MSKVPLFAVVVAPLDAAAVIAAVQEEAERASGRQGFAGAVTSFVGLVRSRHAGRVVLRLEYEAYAPLAMKSFERIAAEAAGAWPGVVLAIHHRIGVLELGEASIVIAAASEHRAEAFSACRFAIERVKQISPIWKRESFEGGDTWIEGATADPDDERAREEAKRRACA